MDMQKLNTYFLAVLLFIVLFCIMLLIDRMVYPRLERNPTPVDIEKATQSGGLKREFEGFYTPATDSAKPYGPGMGIHGDNDKFVPQK